MAIARNYLQCSSCDSKVVVRVAIGHFGDQEHKFPCPECGVEISFSLVKGKKLKIPKASFKNLSNAKWVKSEDGAVKTLTFDPDRVAPADGSMIFSPWMDEFFKMPLRAHQAYGFEEGLRRSWSEKEWPWILNLIVHFNNRNISLFDKEARLDKKSPEATSWGSRLSLLCILLERAFDNFTLNSKAGVDRVRQRLALAKSISPQLFDQLTTDYVTSLRIKILWDELNNIRTLFLALYPSISPLLRMYIYWERLEEKSLTKFALPDKRFEDLKRLYVDCFETLCRLMVMAIGVETIIHHRSLEVPTSKGTMSLWDFEAMANGKKHALLQQYSIHDLFVPAIDSKLRNGIGHHSAFYEAKTDEVVYYSHGEPDLGETRMPYTEFVHKVLHLYSALELAAHYFHSVHIRAIELE